MKDPSSFDKFRPINLCSVIYNIFSKIIVNRLMGCLYCIISPKQEAFLQGRSIFDSITMAQEMVHRTNRKIGGSNIMLKIDTAKVYNRVD